jgi:AraC family cel operon transcriptional repressor
MRDQIAIAELSYLTILSPGRQVHLARARLSSRRPGGANGGLHGQDFPELLWVQNGVVRHHLPSGSSVLTEGDLVFVRAGDRHALQGRGDEALVVSVTLHPDLVAGLLARHPGVAGRLFWSGAPVPDQVHLDSRALADLNQAALRLERSSCDGLAAEAFVLPLLAQLGAEAAALPEGAPDWLARACAAARDPRVFRDGAAGFARVAERAHPHVSRTARRFLGQSPTDYVNDRRMEFAAMRLSGSTDTLAEIAADCGIPNLSHFHKLFRARHGLTPAQWRRQRQKDVIQPDGI